jgi:hypothetical protein
MSWGAEVVGMKFVLSRQSAFVILVLLVSCTAPNVTYGQSAGSSLEDRVRLEIATKEAARLRGWRNIVFICDPLEEEKRPTVKRQRKSICDQTAENVRALAELSAIDVKVVDSWYAVGYYTAATGALELKLKMIFSDCDTAFCVMAAELVAEFDYEDVVDGSEERGFENRTTNPHPIRTPRSATVKIWRSGLMMTSGSDNNEFTTFAVSGVDGLLKSFFGAYSRANREGNTESASVPKAFHNQP